MLLCRAPPDSLADERLNARCRSWATNDLGLEPFRQVIDLATNLISYMVLRSFIMVRYGCAQTVRRFTNMPISFLRRSNSRLEHSDWIGTPRCRGNSAPRVSETELLDNPEPRHRVGWLAWETQHTLGVVNSYMTIAKLYTDNTFHRLNLPQACYRLSTEPPPLEHTSLYLWHGGYFSLS